MRFRFFSLQMRLATHLAALYLLQRRWPKSTGLKLANRSPGATRSIEHPRCEGSWACSFDDDPGGTLPSMMTRPRLQARCPPVLILR
jgi:hypothetical protein